MAGPSNATKASNSTGHSHSLDNVNYLPASIDATFAKSLRQSTAAMLFVSGFDSAQASALDTMTYIVNLYLNAICQNTKLNCETAMRTNACPHDVWLALINMGLDVSGIPEYLSGLSTGGVLVVPPPKHSSANVSNSTLHVGRARPHPPFVNEFLPPFPDPHTYIRTDISAEPESSYERVRELASHRKSASEQSLVDFMLRLHPRTCLFRNFETRVIEEARKTIADNERSKMEMKAARKHAKASEALKTTKVMSAEELMDEDILDTGANEIKKEETELIESDDEKESTSFELEETETSLVLRRIPTYCLVLDPSLETRPYLSALVSEELQDDDTTETKSSSRQNKESDEQVYDNPFLRPPRMPSKGAFARF